MRNCLASIAAAKIIVIETILFLGASSCALALAQNGLEAPASQDTATLTVRSNLVLVPALVKTHDGQLVFALTANDFSLTDNGAPQTLQLEDDTDAQPLALAVVVQTGGLGASHLRDYRDLGTILDAVIGQVQHQVAVVSFDSAPHLAHDFAPDTGTAANAVDNLTPGDGDAAILDALKYAVSILRAQPANYRRAILLFSETIDSGSQTTLESALRAIDDTNTSIYSFGFSSTRSAVKRQAGKLPRPGGSEYSDEPYSKGGCMSHDPAADPDAHGNRSVQALDCASDVLPPIRLARMAFLAARDGFQRNVPESVAQLTGGEYYPFKDAKTLSRHLIAVSHDVPNHYVLSFRPQSPQPGIHALELKLVDRPGLELDARKAYWVDAPATPPATPAGR